jgi:hypothetical protein
MSEPTAMLAVAEGDIKVLGNLMPTLPKHIKTVPDAVATMIVARELGLAPLSSFPDLMIINGNVGMTSKLMLALVNRAGHRHKVIEMSDTEALVEGFRKIDGEWESVGKFGFTIEQAETANLAAKETYVAYPADMLMNKAVARMVRFGFPDVLRGYVPDEIEEITGEQFEDAAHLDPTGEALEAEEVAEILDGEVVE